MLNLENINFNLEKAIHADKFSFIEKLNNTDKRLHFKDILSKASSKEELKKSDLMDACHQFESLFIERLWKEARKTLSDQNIFGEKKSFLETWATDQLYQNYSETLSKTHSFGLAQEIYNQLV